jgi:hypothetical protein
MSTNTKSNENKVESGNLVKPVLEVAFNQSIETSIANPKSEEILKAIMFLKDKEKVSTAQLQLEFKKGYNWAYKVMDVLERNQLVSEFDGKTSYRSVIADNSVFESEIIILDIDDVQ